MEKPPGSPQKASGDLQKALDRAQERRDSRPKRPPNRKDCPEVRLDRAPRRSDSPGGDDFTRNQAVDSLVERHLWCVEGGALLLRHIVGRIFRRGIKPHRRLACARVGTCGPRVHGGPLPARLFRQLRRYHCPHLHELRQEAALSLPIGGNPIWACSSSSPTTGDPVNAAIEFVPSFLQIV